MTSLSPQHEHKQSDSAAVSEPTADGVLGLCLLLPDVGLFGLAGGGRT